MDYPFLIQPLGLLGLLGIPIIILIYLLKSKYVSKPVSSTFIWKRSLKYVKNRLPLSFIFSLLLVLQILTVIIASFAISRPQIPPFATKDTIIILDSSASMMTVNEEGKSRYDLAVEQIKKEAELAGESNKFTVISAGSEAKNLTIRYTEKLKIISALDKTECEFGTADIDGALELANNIQNINPDAKIYLYTDKVYFESTGVEVKDFSSKSDINVGITSLTDTLIGGKYTFNTIINLYAPEGDDPNAVIQKDALINFYLDGALAHTQVVTLTSGKNIVTFAYKESMVADSALYYHIDNCTEYNEVKIEIKELREVGSETVINDGLAEDNTRYIYATEGERVKILVVSEYVTMVKNGDGQMEADSSKTTFLITLLRNIGYSLSNKTDIKQTVEQVNNGGAIEGYDLYIFDGVMPTVLPDDGAVWFLNPKKNPVGTAIQISTEESTAIVGSPYLMIPAFDTGTDTYKTLTKNIGKRNIAIGKFRSMSLDSTSESRGNYEEIFSCDNSPIVMAGREANVRIVCLSFDIHNTNLPVLIDFPLIINNMLSYSLPAAVEDRTFDVGDTVKFSAPVGATSVEFKYWLEDGDYELKDSFDAMDKELVLDKLGNYSVNVTYANGHEQAIMLPTNIPADESDIFAKGDMVVAMDVTTTTGEKDEDKTPMEIWPYLVMALLAIIIIEWGVYYRDEF